MSVRVSVCGLCSENAASSRAKNLVQRYLYICRFLFRSPILNIYIRYFMWFFCVFKVSQLFLCICTSLWVSLAWNVATNGEWNLTSRNTSLRIGWALFCCHTLFSKQYIILAVAPLDWQKNIFILNKLLMQYKIVYFQLNFTGMNI